MKSAGVSIKFLCAAALVFGVTVAPRPTRAAQVVFTFNCIIVNATTCNPTSPLGSLTLADSVADSRRVDLDLTINTQQGIGGLKYFYLNYDQSLPAGPVFGLVAQDAAPDVSEPVSLVSEGSNNTGPAGTRLDLRLFPEASGGVCLFSFARARKVLLGALQPLRPESRHVQLEGRQWAALRRVGNSVRRVCEFDGYRAGPSDITRRLFRGGSGRSGGG